MLLECPLPTWPHPGGSFGSWACTTPRVRCVVNSPTGLGARLGRRHCALCEITHGSVRERPEWRACRAGLPVPFDTYHRDDQPAVVRNAAAGIAPVVVAETDSAAVIVMSPADIEVCAGSIDRLIEAIERAAIRLDLTWTTP